MKDSANGRGVGCGHENKDIGGGLKRRRKYLYVI